MYVNCHGPPLSAVTSTTTETSWDVAFGEMFRRKPSLFRPSPGNQVAWTTSPVTTVTSGS